MLITYQENFKIPEYIIIGAGPAGITIALELEKKNKSVLLIEAGGIEITEKDQSRYAGSVEGDKYFDLDITRLRYFGGSSNHWGGNCAPLDPVDFNEWPIKKKDLDIYESETKKILEINQPFIKYDNSLLESFKLSSINQSNVNFRIKYYQKIIDSKQIFLLLNSNLEFFKTSTLPDTVDSLNLIVNNKKIQIKNTEKSKIILACGGIENSRILLWSRLNSNNKFLYGLPIGNYWMEHPSGEIGQFLGEEKKITSFFKGQKNLFLVPSEDFIKEKNINNLRFSIFFWSKVKVNSLKHIIKDLICIAPNIGKKIVENISDNIVHCLSVVKFSSEQKPSFENRVELSKSLKDDFGVPKVNIKWNIKQDVFDSLQVCLETLAYEFIKKDIGRIGIDKYVYDKSFKKSNDIYGNHHHMGGTIISTDYRRGVVDKNLKVLNTKNLYIAGSSVFPSGGHFNPTYTIVQLSLRLAKHLVQI
jgi:hypothetical protein